LSEPSTSADSTEQQLASTSAAPPSRAREGDRDGRHAIPVAENAGRAVNGAASAVGRTVSGVGKSIGDFFKKFGDTMKEKGIGQAISDAFTSMGTGRFMGAILGGLGAMFIGSIFGGGMIGMIAGLLMVPMGIFLGSQQGRAPIENAVAGAMGATPRQTGATTENAVNGVQMDPALAAAYNQALARDAAAGIPATNARYESTASESAPIPPVPHDRVRGYQSPPQSNVRWNANINYRF
jgi:hypothetical protein